mmetsp:Transcript_50973/g.165128  ORF Transcript_50973/g.165128 Transcript_50973/m.165128 type:complete len:243 (-) Transcript_50973:305-1033(-)
MSLACCLRRGKLAHRPYRRAQTQRSPRRSCECRHRPRRRRRPTPHQRRPRCRRRLPLRGPHPRHRWRKPKSGPRTESAPPPPRRSSGRRGLPSAERAKLAARRRRRHRPPPLPPLPTRPRRWTLPTEPQSRHRSRSCCRCSLRGHANRTTARWRRAPLWHRARCPSPWAAVPRRAGSPRQGPRLLRSPQPRPAATPHRAAGPPRLPSCRTWRTASSSSTLCGATPSRWEAARWRPSPGSPTG